MYAEKAGAFSVINTLQRRHRESRSGVAIYIWLLWDYDVAALRRVARQLLLALLPTPM